MQTVFLVGLEDGGRGAQGESMGLGGMGSQCDQNALYEIPK